MSWFKEFKIDENALDMKQTPFHKLTENVENASKKESEEILSEIESLTDEDLKISTEKDFSV